MNIYYYLYYKVYSFIKTIRKEAPQWHTNTIITFLIGTNLLVFIDIVKRRNIEVLGPMIVNIISSRGVAAFYFITIYVVNYFLFLQNDKYKKMCASFSKERIYISILGSVLVLCYCVFTIWSVFNIW